MEWFTGLIIGYDSGWFVKPSVVLLSHVALPFLGAHYSLSEARPSSSPSCIGFGIACATEQPHGSQTTAQSSSGDNHPCTWKHWSSVPLSAASKGQERRAGLRTASGRLLWRQGRAAEYRETWMNYWRAASGCDTGRNNRALQSDKRREAARSVTAARSCRWGERKWMRRIWEAVS